MAVHCGAGELELIRENYGAARDAFEKAIEVADDIGHAQGRDEARLGLALGSLLANDLASARRLIEAAGQYHHPLREMDTSVLLGVVSYRQGDGGVSKQAFTAAINQADALLALTPERYAALDAKAIALCGLVLCGEAKQVIAAEASFRAARAITSAAGVVHAVLQLFGALALGDDSHLIANIRPAAAEASSEGPKVVDKI